MGKLVRLQGLKIDTSWAGCNERDYVSGEVPLAIDVDRVVRVWEDRATESTGLPHEAKSVVVTWIEIEGSDDVSAVRGTLGEVLEKLDMGRR